MKISCTNGMVSGRSLTEKAQKLKKWGFDAISLQIPLMDRTPELEEEILALESNADIKVCEFSYIGPEFGLQLDSDRGVADKAIATQLASIDMCGKLHAGNAIGFEYRARNPLPMFETDHTIPEDLKVRFVDVLNKVGKEARKKNVEFSIEAINRYETRYVNNLTDCRNVIANTEPALDIGILADFFHMSMEESDIPQAIRESRGFIKHVHLGENNRLLPGYGSVNWTEGFRALKEIDYTGYVALECGVPGDPEKTLLECVEFLKKIIQSV